MIHADNMRLVSLSESDFERELEAIRATRRRVAQIAARRREVEELDRVSSGAFTRSLERECYERKLVLGRMGLHRGETTDREIRRDVFGYAQ